MYLPRLLPVVVFLVAAVGCSRGSEPPSLDAPPPETAMQRTSDPLIDRDLMFGNPERT